MDVYQITFADEAGKEYKKLKMRKWLIKDQNKAMRAAQQYLGKSATAEMLEIMTQQELLKLIIVEVNGKKPDPVMREDLDRMLTPMEMNKCLLAMQQIQGAGGADPLAGVGIEMVPETTGSQSAG